MSLYNTLFGVNELAPVLLKCLNLDAYDVPRFRDCFFAKDNTICIHTRTGGGNREEYESENEWLASHEYYIYDEDDEYDCTYANFYFHYPKEFEEDLTALAGNVITHVPSEKWKMLFEAMKEEVKP